MSEHHWDQRVRAVVEEARKFVALADEFPPEQVGEGEYWPVGEQCGHLVDRLDELAGSLPATARIADLETQLAEAQAREAEFREACRPVAEWLGLSLRLQEDCRDGEVPNRAILAAVDKVRVTAGDARALAAALALPADDTALRETMQAAMNAYREKRDARELQAWTARENALQSLRDALRYALVDHGECTFCGRDGITACDCEYRDPLQGAVLRACEAAGIGWKRGEDNPGIGWGRG